VPVVPGDLPRIDLAVAGSVALNRAGVAAMPPLTALLSR
jgi:hypothetical protein